MRAVQVKGFGGVDQLEQRELREDRVGSVAVSTDYTD
jgi:hypothetical protein